MGVDPTASQLDTARDLQLEFGFEFPSLESAAESVPLADESFDLVVSEYGASIWADPTVGSPRRADCFARRVASSSSATRRS